MTMLIAHISDLHVVPPGQKVCGRVDTAAYLERAVSHLGSLDPQPDIVIATGDLTDAGEPAAYARLRALLQPLRPPVFVIPGNHDDRAALGDAFRDAGYLPRNGRRLHYTVKDWPVRLIALDTLVPGEGGGSLEPADLSWLEDRLAEQPERPTLILMHHPPILTGIQHMDEVGLKGADGFKAVVARHGNIERIVCGHIHRSIQARFAGTLVSVAPSTAHQVLFDLRDGAPGRFTMEPPGFQLHLWEAGPGMRTHTVPIGKFNGPYLFEDDGDQPSPTAETS
jgi:3',5'-cyclic AMP phosphodiesterase CpdA